GIIAVVASRPKPGREQELWQLVRSRVPTLRKEGLVTDGVPTVMRPRDRKLIEVSEWKSREAIDAVHKNPSVLAMWEKFSAVCECVPLKTLPQADDMFAGFESVVDRELQICPFLLRLRVTKPIQNRPMLSCPATRVDSCKKLSVSRITCSPTRL